jgi:hypothetical protein
MNTRDVSSTGELAGLTPLSCNLEKFCVFWSSILKISSKAYEKFMKIFKNNGLLLPIF